MSKDKICPRCGQGNGGPIRIWRTNTMFVDKRLNYQESCYGCIEENDYMRYWDWAEYYGSVYGYYERGQYTKRPTTAWVHRFEYLRAVQPKPTGELAGCSDEREY